MAKLPSLLIRLVSLPFNHYGMICCAASTFPSLHS